MLTSCFSGARGSAFFNIERMITGSVPEMTYKISIISQPGLVKVSQLNIKSNGNISAFLWLLVSVSFYILIVAQVESFNN